MSSRKPPTHRKLRKPDAGRLAQSSGKSKPAGKQPSRSAAKPGGELLRLQKYLAQSGVASRRESEKLITLGVVRVNGKVVTELGTQVDPSRDEISVRGDVVRRQKKSLYVFFKPVNVVTTMRDPEGRPSVGDYTEQLPEKVFPVGRLDFDACGLLLLTNDGDFAEELLHPRFEVPRVYWAQVEGMLEDTALRSLERGFKLEDGRGAAKRAQRLSRERFQSLVSPKRSPGAVDFLEVTVAEGRNHFVKRLLAAAAHPVIRLCRVSYGEFQLGNLRPGEVRKLDLSDRKRSTRGAKSPRKH